MNTQNRVPPPIRYSRTNRRRKPALNVDLNVAPPVGNQGQEGTSTNASTHVEQPSSEGIILPPTPIDVEAFDDEVVISSPRAFAEAKNNSRRNRRRTIVDVDSEDPSSWVTLNKRTKFRGAGPNQTIINCDLFINLDGNSSSVKDNVPSTAPPPPPPPVKEPTFSCPICMGPLVEEMSTKCGHIFCKKCIKAALNVQNKCPSCRKKVTVKELIRVYLPTAT